MLHYSALVPRYADSSDINTKPTTVSICITIPIAVLAVVFRLLVRWHMRLRLGADDYMIIAGMIFSVADIALDIWGNYVGNGQWVDTLTESQLKSVLLWYYVSEQFYGPAITCIKLSVLLMYRRIFIYRWFRTWTNILIGLVVAWYITNAFLAAFQCRPAQAYFEPSIAARPGTHCLNAMAVILGLQIPNVLLDILILASPLLAIQKLKLPKAKKIGTSLVFLMGGLSVACSCTRLGVIIGETAHHDDLTHTTGKIVWSNVELGVGVLAACLPTYTPLLKTRRKVHDILISLHELVSGTGSEKSSRRGSQKGVNGRGLIKEVDSDSLESEAKTLA